MKLKTISAVVWATLLVLGVSFSALCYQVMTQARQDAEAQASAIANNALDMVQANIEHSVEVFDASIRGTIANLSSPTLQILNEEQRPSFLFDRSATLIMSSMYVTDASGKIRYASTGSTSRTSIADKAFFHAHKANPSSDLIISEPFYARNAGTWVIAFSRRYTDENDRFAGIVTGCVNVDYFAGILSDFKLGSKSYVTLFHERGQIIFRNPFKLKSIGQRTNNSDLIPSSNADRVIRTRFSDSDGIERQVTVGRIRNLPLLVSVGLSTNEIYRAWQSRTYTLLTIIGILLSSAVMLGGLVVREFKQRKARELELASVAYRFERLSHYDGLTGLPNRRAFNEHLERTIETCSQKGLPLICMMIDVDYFKKLNDICGHLYGDDALAKVGAALARSLQGSGDFVARYGGEEFAILLPDTAGAGAYVVAQRIREAVRILDIDNPLGLYGKLTVSIGFATYVEGMTASKFVDAADHALYSAKRHGRDCIVSADRNGVDLVDDDELVS